MSLFVLNYIFKNISDFNSSFPLQEQLRCYSELYDLSRSDRSKVCELAVTMVTDGQPLGRIRDLLNVAVGRHDLSVKSVLQEAVRRVVAALRQYLWSTHTFLPCQDFQALQFWPDYCCRLHLNNFCHALLYMNNDSIIPSSALKVAKCTFLNRLFTFSREKKKNWLQNQKLLASFVLRTRGCKETAGSAFC